jgi:hypothetical protein
LLVACAVLAAVTLTSAQSFAQSFTILDVSPVSDSVGSAKHAVDASGNAMFLWSVNSVGGAFRTRRYDASTDTFSAPIDLLTSPGTYGHQLSLVLDPAGDATAFGFHYTGVGATARMEIVAARYSVDTGQWGTFTTLMSPVPSGAEGYPRVPVGVVDADGNVTVVWRQATCGTCSTYVLYAARWAASGNWSVGPIAENVWIWFEPAVAVDGSGNVLAVAARANEGRVTILAARYAPASATWSVSADGPEVNTHLEFRRGSLLRMTADGRALLAWQDSFGLYGARFQMATGLWGRIRPLSSTIAALEPQVAHDQSGNFMVMWNTGFTLQRLPRLLTRLYSWNTDTLSEEITLPAIVAPVGGHIAIGGDGIPTAVWLDVGLGQSHILKAARYDAGTGLWSDAGEITSVPSQGYLAPVGLSGDTAGSLRISWLSRASSSSNTVLQTTRWLPGTTTPGAPGNLRASVIGNTVTFAWTAPTTGAAATGYTLVARATAGGPVIATVPMGAGETFTATAPNGVYVVSVTASNPNGTGPESPSVTVTVPQAGAPPGPPSNLMASVTGTTTTFSWSAPASGGALTNYILVAGLTPGFGVPYATMALGSTPGVSVPGVPQGTFYVRVLAQNASGTSAPSNEITVTVAGATLPGAPTLHPPMVTGSTVALSWSAGAGEPPTHYTLTASATPGGAPIVSVPLTGTATSFANVPAGTYFLRLTASNGAGTSTSSAELTVIVP